MSFTQKVPLKMSFQFFSLCQVKEGKKDVNEKKMKRKMMNEL